MIAKATVSTTGLVQNLDYTSASYTSTPNRLAAVLAAGGYLYVYGKDGSFQPDLAKDMPVFSADGKTMTVTLRDGLTYSDGTAVQARDAVTAYERTKAGPHAARVNMIDKVEVNGTGQIVYTLNAPFNFKAQGMLFNDWLPLNPSDKVNDPAYWTKPVSATKYVIQEYTPGSPILTLKANPNYWAGKPAIDSLVLSAATDPTSRILQVTTGAVDMAVDIPFSVTNLLPKEVKTTVTPIGGVFWVAFNWQSATAALSDVKVRKAVCLAIDRDALVKRAFLGQSEVAGSLVSKYTPGWTAVSTLPNNGARDVATARSLLGETPYAGGFTFKLQTWTNRAGWSDAAAVIAENLKDIGITATIDGVTDTVGIANIKSSSFEAMFSGGAGDVLSLVSVLFDANGLWTLGTHFNDPEITSGVPALRQQASDATAFNAAAADLLQKEWTKDATYCPLAERVIVVGSRLSTDVISVIPSAQYIWVGVAK